MARTTRSRCASAGISKSAAFTIRFTCAAAGKEIPTALCHLRRRIDTTRTKIGCGRSRSRLGCDGKVWYVNQNAPRSGARNLARGTRFLRTPGKKTPLNVRTPDGVRGIRDTPSGCVSFFQYTIQVYAKNAYAWLISQHASGVQMSKVPLMI